MYLIYANMTTKNARHDRGRAAHAADLIATLAEQLPLIHPARATVRELQMLFPARGDDRIRLRLLLEKVPGDSLRAKGRRIGIPHGAVWAIFNGKYRPNPEIMARIEEAARETVDA